MLDLSCLNDAQRDAVMHGEGPLLVLAGPGSGKTFTIIQRIFWLLEKEHIQPEKILVITFTKDAAMSMQSRFLKMSNQILPVNFGTFHSVFYHIIRETNIQNSFHILTEAEKEKLIIPIIQKYIPREELQYGRNELSKEAVSILSAISYFKNTGSKEEGCRRLSNMFQSKFDLIYEEYEKLRSKERGLDFDDMVYECYRVLSQNPEIRTYWQKRFSHILMDEFQDINPMQYKVIQMLADKPYQLFAVGDDDQAIYGFRGSKPECLKRFAKEFRARQIYLNMNYRSREEIIHASLRVIADNKNRFHKQLKSARDEKEEKRKDTVMIRSFESREQEYEYLVSALQNTEEKQSVGVLFRTNTYMQSLAVWLNRRGVSYIMKEKMASIYEHFIVKDIVAYIKVAIGGANRATFLQIMNKPTRYISREAIEEETPTFRKIRQYYQKEVLNAKNRALIQSIELWERQMDYLKNLSPFLAVQYIRKVIGYEGYLRGKSGRERERWQEWEELLNWITMDATRYKTISEWFEAQENYTENMFKKKQSQDEKLPVISLMTVHASKGLEFDKVYIPDCNEKVFPHGSLLSSDDCEEERRIFYVAMTRAKENLELLYISGTKECPRFYSRFLNQIIKDYSSTSSSNSQLSRYSSKASATFSYSSSSEI